MDNVDGSMTILTIKAVPQVSSHKITDRINRIPERSQVQSSQINGLNLPDARLPYCGQGRQAGLR